MLISVCADCILNVYDVTLREKEVRLYIYTHVLGVNKSLAWCTNLALTSAKLLQPGSSGRSCVSAARRSLDPVSCTNTTPAQPALMHRQGPTADSGSLSSERARTPNNL